MNLQQKKAEIQMKRYKITIDFSIEENMVSDETTIGELIDLMQSNCSGINDIQLRELNKISKKK